MARTAYRYTQYGRYASHDGSHARSCVRYLRSREAVVGADVLDVFAGSGAYGFEALSQGANSVVFFDHQPLAQKTIRKNADSFDCVVNTRVVAGDVLVAPKAEQSADLAFFDPPYQTDLLKQSIAHLATQGWLDEATLLVLEMQKDDAVPANVTVLDTRLYGKSKIVLANLAV
jgi:16S rRNA (guanine966-N2)-methyltransferase